MNSHTTPALALFDIDGTLLRRAGPHHRRALEEGIRRVTGIITTTDGIPLWGMLDPVIIREMLRQAGTPKRVARERMAEIVRAAEEVYLSTCPPLHGKTCPGVVALLRSLERRGIVMALVTGNLTRIGWRKMERAGLERYFCFGAFGEMAADRAGLARLAIAHARRKGWLGAGTRISLIGDAPADIQAARANGVRAIAVATGVVPVSSLEEHRPDLLLEDLTRLTPEMLTS